MKLRWKIFSLLGFFGLAGSTLFLTSCGCSNDIIKISSFNLSFAIDNSTDSFASWQGYMSKTREEQEKLINDWKNLPENTPTNDELKLLAERMIQIRNVAAIIQNQRPDVLLVNDFNSDGTNIITSIHKGFQENFLSYGQSLNSVDGGDVQKPIKYPHVEQYASNTGLQSEFDLDNNGIIGQLPGDAFGFGYFHGQHAFGLMSMYPIVQDEVRTFQEFKWKDMPGAESPIIIAGAGDSRIPEGMKPGDPWYSTKEWEQMRLSSKNHVDVPIEIKKSRCLKEKVHLLMSHPIAPTFDDVTKNNQLRNQAEIEFWKYYIQNEDFIYDDKGVNGGLDGSNEKFVILGDLNADALDGDGREGIISLAKSEFINKEIMEGNLVPTSSGAEKEPNPPWENGNISQLPNARTSTFGLRVDYVLPSKNLEVASTSVYWKAEGEKGRLLFNDSRVGKFGNGKEVSSDHRLVSVNLRIKDSKK